MSAPDAAVAKQVWRCAGCGYETTTFTGKDGAQTHANDSGHARIVAVTA